jgi:hypothetical protein
LLSWTFSIHRENTKRERLNRRSAEYRREAPDDVELDEVQTELEGEEEEQVV